jgi:hypothetical protein
VFKCMQADNGDCEQSVFRIGQPAECLSDVLQRVLGGNAAVQCKLVEHLLVPLVGLLEVLVRLDVLEHVEPRDEQLELLLLLEVVLVEVGVLPQLLLLGLLQDGHEGRVLVQLFGLRLLQVELRELLQQFGEGCCESQVVPVPVDRLVQHEVVLAVLLDTEELSEALHTNPLAVVQIAEGSDVVEAFDTLFVDNN